MTRDESIQLVSMILSHWHTSKEWTAEEIDVYARMIQDLDAEIATSTLIRAAKEMAYRPSISEFRERYRTEKRRLAPEVEPPTPGAPQELPFWIRRWLCARFLYDRFGKERDLRRFPEQLDFGDKTQEMMPEGAWVKEAESLSEGALAEAFRKMFRS